MMNKFKHYILTRYNLGLYSENPYKIENKAEWENRRRVLFKKCQESINRQTNQNFTWVLSFDKNSPYQIMPTQNAIVIFEQPHEWLRKQQLGADWLITSRIDNDDFYDFNFVETIQKEFREVEEVIDIDYKVLELATGKEYQSKRERANSPFLSLVERWGENPMTAMGRPHTIMPELYSARKLNVLATQVIHEANISNKIPE